MSKKLVPSVRWCLHEERLMHADQQRLSKHPNLMNNMSRGEAWDR